MSRTDDTSASPADTLAEICRATGTIVRSFGKPPLLLTDPTRCLFVTEGSVDLFAVSLDATGKPAGRRTYVATLETGDLAFGVEGPIMALLAVGNVHSQIVRCPLATLTGSGPVPPEGLVAAVDHWIERLSGAVAAYVLPRPSLGAPDLEPTGRRPLPANLRFTAGNAVTWLDGIGESLWCDSVHLLPGEGPFPVPSTAWLSLLMPAETELSATADRLADGRLAAGLARFHEAVLEALATNVGLARVDTLNLQRERRRQDRGRVRSALEAVLAVNRQRPVQLAGGDDGDPLTRIVRVLAQAKGMPSPHLQKHEQELAASDRLLLLLRSSRLRSRPVRLEAAWWQTGGLPLIATTKDNRPLALLPRSSGGYRVFDPETGRTRPLTRKQADTLESSAHAVYSSLSQDRVSAHDLLALGLRGAFRDLVALLGFGLGAAVIGLLTPYFTGILINEAIPYADRQVVLELAGILAVVALMVAVLQFLQATALLRLESAIEANAQPALWDRVLHLSSEQLQQWSIGDLVQRVVALSQIRAILSKGVAQSMLAGIFSSTNFVMMILYGGWLTLAALLVALVTLVVAGTANLIQVKWQRRALEAQATLTGMATQAFSAVSKLQVAGADDRLLARLVQAQADYRRRFYDSRLAEGFSRAANTIFPALGTLVFFVTLEFLMEPEALSAGDYVAFTAAFGGFITGVIGMLNSVTAGLLALVLYERLQPLLKTAPERRIDAAQPGILSGRVELNRVTFRYHEGGPKVLDALDLRIEAGQFVAIVGGSGSGKSTLMRLMLGFGTPDAGNILYDGKDLTRLDRQAVRRQFGVVLQKSQPFGGSILDNIVGSRALSEKDAWQAAETVGLARDIRTMPMGMHTVVHDGATLSGGQRQRLMLARAVVGRPRILFMDEATSALDNRTQAIVAENLAQMTLTRIVIAHRLSTIKDADVIYVLDRGRLVESGNYESLMAEGGLFAAFAQRQVM